MQGRLRVHPAPPSPPPHSPWGAVPHLPFTCSPPFLPPLPNPPPPPPRPPGNRGAWPSAGSGGGAPAGPGGCTGRPWRPGSGRDPRRGHACPPEPQCPPRRQDRRPGRGRAIQVGRVPHRSPAGNSAQLRGSGLGGGGGDWLGGAGPPEGSTAPQTPLPAAGRTQDPEPGGVRTDSAVVGLLVSGWFRVSGRRPGAQGAGCTAGGRAQQPLSWERGRLGAGRWGRGR